ncbi:zinc finger protein 318-like isoform X2 [Rhineura floridana]|uniref:zinc finger protein 318-like isoform X2 n=1 Tax=Rhineura floridana TaxID=261503 RepID=UPI002AC7EAC4|nr:zinc finger protein 318-like isoform X2 [Rhineura floridana]
MYRTSRGHSSVSSSNRSKESSSLGSRSSRSGGSGSTRGRSPCRSRSPSSRGRRYRSPSSSRSSRRSSSPRRNSRRYSPGRRSCSPGRRSRSPGRRSRSPGRRSRSPGRRSRSPGRRSRSPGRRSRSPGRRSRPPGRRSRSPGRRSRSPGRRSPSRHSESSVEQNLRITVGNDRYGIDTPERKRLSDRLGSPVYSLSDVDRDDLADGPIFSRGLSRPRSLERYPSCEEHTSSPFSMRHDEDYHSRDVFLHQSDYSVNYDYLQDLPKETDRDGILLRKSSYSSEDRGRDPKRPRYDRDDRLIDMSIEPQGFLPGTRNYRKRSPSRSPSPPYLDFRELDSARRKREEELSRNLNRELPGHGYMIPGMTNPLQSSEPRYLYRPDEAPAMPKKSILKKRVDDPSLQPEVFSSSSASVKEPPLSDHPPLQKRTNIAPFSSEVENFLKQFNKNAIAESASKESQGNVHDWKLHSGQQQNTSPFEQNFGSFLKQKDYYESTSEPEDRHNDFLLPHERASQDGSGFSRILGMMADSTSAQEKRRRSFPDIEDEEKFLYGDDEDNSTVNSPSSQKPTLSGSKQPEIVKESSLPPASPSVKPDTSEESRPEYEKIHDLLKTIGLDIGVAEIGKLAARTQERLHGKKPSRSPDRHLVASHKLESRERHHSRSDTHSPESRQNRSLSPSGSFPPSKEMSSVSNSEHTKSKIVGQDSSAVTPEQSAPSLSLMPSAPPLPNLSPTSTSVSQYRVSRFSPFTATQLPQNYPSPTMPPPGYDAYGHYMAYAASGWPMYAPPQQADPTLSDVHGLVTLTVPPNPTRPNLRVIETVSTGRGTPDIKRDESVLVQIPTATPYPKCVKERISDERNRASQKQKVIEEREKLRAEQAARQKKLHYLRTELDRLSKQQGEMLRKKRREKDGHKDPLLVEVNRLQENIVKEIAQLKINAEAAEKKQSELDKVAQILGINIFEKSRKQSSENKDTSEKNKSENAKGQEGASNSIKELKTTNDKPGCRSPKPTESSLQPSKQHSQEANIYDYYDTGNHWCKDCNTICGTMFDFFTHMHNKKHRQTLDPYNRPWASKTQTETKQELTKRIDRIPVPAKGSEFLMPVTGYYCQLCHEFFGDQISAEQHVKNNPHNEKYKKYVDENPLYEDRRNLDRQAGLSVIQETERRLKRKQCEKQKEERDEKTAKVARKEEPKSKEEPKNAKELGDGDNENETSKRKGVPNGQKYGIKLKLKKDDKEVEKKEGKKEESQKESRLSSFGKFSWRKTERDEKNQGKDTTVFKGESAEEGKDKESKSQSGKPNSKPIAIKLSGKTVIPHSNPWTPVVSTSSQAKIRPNLPAPMMVLRKSATATVSKPAPLNTFLSIKSSGAITKPLPVVKESNHELVLPPDIISKAFGGEVVVLKGSQENAKVQPEEREHESLSQAIEHAKALEHAKATVAKAQEQAVKTQEQANVVAKAQAKARELAAVIKEQVTRLGIFERPHRRRPLLPLPPGPPLSVALPVPPPVVFPPLPLMPPKQAAVLADDLAPGVSEDDKNILAMPMCPRPLPPPTIFGDHVKKLEKKNSCLAAGNAKDLYDIFYNRSGRSPADSKSVNSAISDKRKLNPVEREENTDLLAGSKPSSKSFTQDSLQNVHSSSYDSKIPLGDMTQETEDGKVEKILAAYEENFKMKASFEGESEKVSFSERQSTFTYREAKESDYTINASVSFQNEVEMGTPDLAEFSKKSPATQIFQGSPRSLDDLSRKPTNLETAEFKSPANKEVAMQLSEDHVALLEDVSKKPSELQTPELAIQLPENNASSLEELCKNPLVYEAAEFKSPDDKEVAMQLPEDHVALLEDVGKKPSELQTPELAIQLPENNASSLEELCKNPLVYEAAEFKSPEDKEVAMQLSEDHAALLEDVSKKPSELQTPELAIQLPENNASSLDELCKNPLVYEATEFKSPDGKELAVQLSEDHVALLEDVSKKPSELQTPELAIQLPENNASSLDELCKNPLVYEATEFKSPDGKELAVQLSEDHVALLEDISEKKSELVTTELAMQLPESSVPPLDGLSNKPADLKTTEIKSPVYKELTLKLSEDHVALLENINKASELEAAELPMQLPESNASPLEELCKNPSVCKVAEFKSFYDKKLAVQLSEEHVALLQDDSKKPSELETAELAMQLPETNVLPLEKLCNNPSMCETAEFRSPDDKDLAMQLSEDVTVKPSELETTELAIQLSESSVPSLDDLSNQPRDLEMAKFKFQDDKELGLQMSEDHEALSDVSKKPSKLETLELAMQLPESNASPLEELYRNPLACEITVFKSEALSKYVCNKPLELETAEFKYPDDKELVMQLPENETDFTEEPVLMRDVGMATGEDISENLQDQQKMDKSKLDEFNKDLEMKAYLASLSERDVGKEHLEFAGHQFAVNQEDESQLFEMQIETPKEEGPAITEDTQVADSSKLTISTWVSEVCVQSPLVWGPIVSSSDVKKENSQRAMIDRSSSKEQLLDLKWGTVGLDRLESAISDESPQTSEVHNVDSELKPLNKDESAAFYTNNEQELLFSSKPKDGKNSNVVDIPEAGEMSDECLANVTVASTAQRQYEKISQHPLSKDSQAEGDEALSGISSTNDTEPSDSVELMFIKNDTCRPSESGLDLKDSEERGSTETDTSNFSSVQPEMIHEPLDALPTEISVEHLGEEALTFTDMNTGVLNTSASGDLDLNTTYPELNFDQTTTLSLNLNVENERESPKSDEIKPKDPPGLKRGLELETMTFSLGDIEVGREHLGILPSEILNEDIGGSPKLETIASICLKSSKTSELGIGQPAVESEMMDFVVLTSGDQEDKLCSLVSDVIVPRVVSPASNGSTAGPSVPLLEMQDMPPISKVLQPDVRKGGTSDTPSLSYDEKNLQSQAAECKQSFLPALKKTSVEMGGSGDHELYIVKNDIQTSAGEVTKTEEVENNDRRCEVNSKLASEITESSAEHLLL